MLALSAVEDGHGRGNAAAVLQGRNGGIRRDRPSDPALITRPPALLSSFRWSRCASCQRDSQKLQSEARFPQARKKRGTTSRLVPDPVRRQPVVTLPTS